MNKKRCSFVMLRFATVVFVIVVAAAAVATATTTTATDAADADAATVDTRIDVWMFQRSVHAFFYFVVIRTFLPFLLFLDRFVGWLVG